MKFVKMHGLGNDYIFVDCFERNVRDPKGLSRAISDRHTGVGGDGLILIRHSDVADAKMEVFNADGSRAQMCGNGIRCVGKWLVESGRAGGLNVRIETDAGVRDIECELSGGKVSRVRVDMGKPNLLASVLPACVDVDRIIAHPMRFGRDEFALTCVSMGNPHAVIFVDDLDAFDLQIIGPLVERARAFPERINVHLARVDGSEHITMKTWERGSGITRACGTGACAVCVAGVVTERTRREVTVTLPGGDLALAWVSDDHVYQTGLAVEVFSGEWPT